MQRTEWQTKANGSSASLDAVSAVRERCKPDLKIHHSLGNERSEVKSPQGCPKRTSPPSLKALPDWQRSTPCRCTHDAPKSFVMVVKVDTDTFGQRTPCAELWSHEWEFVLPFPQVRGTCRLSYEYICHIPSPPHPRPISHRLKISLSPSQRPAGVASSLSHPNRPTFSPSSADLERAGWDRLPSYEAATTFLSLAIAVLSVDCCVHAPLNLQKRRLQRPALRRAWRREKD